VEEIKEQRIQSIDVIRGISIFGILIVNMYSYHSTAFYVNPIYMEKNELDQWTWWFTDVFFQASFYPLFAILFGFGLAVQMDRIRKRGESIWPPMLRRLLFLLLIGLIHAIFLWSGDILVVYAVLGFLFLPAARMKAKNLFRTALLLYILPSFFLLIFGSQLNGKILDETIAQQIERAEESALIYKEGSFMEVTGVRFKEWAVTNGEGAIILFILVYPLILFGASLAKSGILHSTEKSKKVFKNLLFATLPLGLLFKISPYVEGHIGSELLQDLIGGPLLSIAYFAAIILLVSKGKRKILSYIANVGRMSLSNYIFQSVICTTFFYGYGFGLFGEVSYFEGTMIAIGIYVLQIFVSNHWLKKYHQGPLEAIWRQFTYLVHIKMKKG